MHPYVGLLRLSGKRSPVVLDELDFVLTADSVFA